MANDRRFQVKTLTLENFRRFEKADLGPFDPHFNLLVGENGSGKSSVLVALADLFANVALVNIESRASSVISEDDERISYSVAENGISTAQRATSMRIFATAALGGKEILAENLKDQLVPSIGRYNHLTDAETKLGWIRRRDANGDWIVGPEPLILLYPARRSFKGATPASGTRTPDARFRIAAFENWFDASVSADALREWFKTQTLSALQRAMRARSGMGGSAPTTDQVELLQMVSNAVASAVEGARLAEFDADRDDIVVEFSDGKRTEFLKMSDGQRAMVGLFADIARRACILNAALLGSRTLEETAGLVLIDEIDLHLHPRWQRQIVGALKRTFPNIQFFASTHSPQVIGEARPEEIVMLTKSGQQMRPMGSFGLDSNWVLECVMEAEDRDPAIAERVKHLFDEIEDGHFEKARALIEYLRKLIGNFAPDITAAESYIWRVEHEPDDEAAE